MRAAYIAIWISHIAIFLMLTAAALRHAWRWISGTLDKGPDTALDRLVWTCWGVFAFCAVAATAACWLSLDWAKQ